MNKYGVINREDTLPRYYPVFNGIKKGPKSLPTESELKEILNNTQFLDPYEQCHYDVVTGSAPRVKHITDLHIHQLFTRKQDLKINSDRGPNPKNKNPYYHDGFLRFIASWTREWEFNSWDTLSWGGADYLRDCTGRYILYITNWLMECLRQEKYFSVRSDQELIEEVSRRRRQYPRQKIYGFIGSQMADYIRGVRKGTYLDVDWIEVPQHGDTGMSGTKVGAGMGAWESAIVATQQIKWNNSHTFTWLPKRITRAWKIMLSPVWIFGAEIKSNELTNEVIEEPKTPHHRRAAGITLEEERQCSPELLDL